MSKMKKVLKHTHVIKYSSKDDYLEEDAGVLVLKAVFSIYPDKKRIHCAITDERFHLMVSGFINPGSIYDSAEGLNIQRPTYISRTKLTDYVMQFHNQDIVFTGVAKCHPDDIFDIQTGKQLALAKALDKRDKAIRTVKKLVDEGITTALCTIASQMRYNVCPNSKLEKVEGKIEEKSNTLV